MNEINKIFIPIHPMGAVRTTQKQKFVDTRAKKYFAYKQVIALFSKKYFKKAITGPISIEIVFYMPIPKNGKSKGKKVNIGQIHVIKPDIDNLIKGVFDSLNKIAWKDDAQVYEVHSKKVYSTNPGIALELWELDNDGPKTETNREEKTGDNAGSIREHL